MRPYRRKRKSTFGRLRNLWQAFPLSPDLKAIIEAEEDVNIPDLPLLWPQNATGVEGHRFQQFRGSRSNDAEVYDLRIGGTWVELVLSDYWLENLISVFTDDRPWHERRRFSISFRFTGVSEWKIFEVHRGGSLGRTRHSVGGKYKSLWDYIEDRVVVWTEGRIVVLMKIYQKSYRGRKRRMRNRAALLLAIDAAAVEVIENTRELWIKQVGEEWLWLLDEFEKKRDHVWYGTNDLELFIDEQLKRRDLEWPSFSGC